MNRYLMGLLIAFVASFCFADDCLVSTLPPEKLSTLPGVNRVEHNEESGSYITSFDNGDQILSRYGTCELALDVHYLFRTSQNPSIEALKKIIAATIPGQQQVAIILNQLDDLQPVPRNSTIELKGLNDSHTLMLMDSSSPLFVTELHYQWNPPLH
ncbi:hypothetical protein P886_3055 [Alteromonadaceae bacterium 2753L.S.0a.02]|nr:hypothetical protein P886_3055 [Alteromonadaceae bacterium 2753L.S.0a.02]